MIKSIFAAAVATSLLSNGAFAATTTAPIKAPVVVTAKKAVAVKVVAKKHTMKHAMHMKKK